MKRICILLMLLFSMTMVSQLALAQETTITLLPGCTWISYTQAESMNIATALGDFVPMEGDVIKSQYASTTYSHGRWMGRLQQFTPGLGYMYISMRGEPVSLVFAASSSSFVATATPTDITATSAVVGGTITLPEGSHVFMRGVCWGTTPNSDIDGSHTSEEPGVGFFTNTLEGLTPSTTYYVRAYAVTNYGLDYGEELSFTTLVEYAYVDLGLPSGLLWATCNIGAETPEDYGDYFAWGETQPKSSYNWSTYQYCLDSHTTMTKYCTSSSYGYNGFTDNLTTLLSEDDAATANWGSDWRMPTKEEWQELYNNTTHTWTTQNGVNGRLFTASNGNSLFLPAAGYHSGSSLDNAGSYGPYWSSSLYTGSPDYAWDFYFDFNSDSYGMNNTYRYVGQSVRAVRSDSNPQSFLINVSANPSNGGTITGTGNYAEGATCTLTATANDGYTFSNWTENNEVVSTDAEYSFTVTGNRNLVANFISQSGAPIGAIDGLFTINADGAQVRFSQGNLQYQASTNTWRFAENQWDYVGEDNSNISSEYDGWIDLFGWGTSGYHNIYDNFNVNYQPYSTSAATVNTECNYYGYGPSTNMYDPNLTGLNAGYDWGVHNAISNGGNQAGMWRTLSRGEWEYLFITRSASTVGNTSNARFAKATVNGIPGVILFPDDFSVPYYLPTPLQINNGNASFSVNSYSGEGWSVLENLGCVFLPIAGYRSNYYNYYHYNYCTFIYSDAGNYWSTSYCNKDGAYKVYFYSSGLYLNDALSRFMGASVRLVRDAE